MKLNIIYIGKENTTNSIIRDMLMNEYEAKVVLLDPAKLNDDPSIIQDMNADLILTDHNTIPGNAPEYIRRIRKHINDIPILALHFYDSQKFIDPLLNAGANGFLSNTPSEADLYSAVNTLVNGESGIDGIED